MDGAGVDDIADVAGADGIQDLVAALADLVTHAGADAVLLEEGGGAGRGLDVEAHVVEAAHQRQGFLPVLAGDRDKDGAVVLQLHARGLQRLVHGAAELVVIADGLAGGLHLGREVGVQTLDLVPGEDGDLDVMALLFIRVEIEEALLLQAFAQDDLGGDVREGVARGLGQEGHRAGGAGVDLDDIDVLVAVDDELDVVQADDADAETELFGVLQDDALDPVGDGEGGVDADGVAGMDAGTLDELHDAGDEDVAAVADGVHLDLLALDVLVDEDGLVGVDLHRGLEVVTQHVFVRDDLHRAAAEHEARPDQDRVADLGGGPDAVLDVGDGGAAGLGDVEVQQDLFKAVAVFGALDGGAVGPDDFYAAVHEGLSEVDGGLAAEGGDDALGLLIVDNGHDVLGGQRLEIQFVAGGIVGGNRLGVVVDDDGFKAGTLDGLDGVDGGIVKLHALADADGAGAEDDDLFLLGQAALVFAAVGGVEIGNVFAGVQGVNHAEDRREAEPLPAVPELCLVHVPETGDIAVGKAHALGIGEDRVVVDLRAQPRFHVRDLFQRFEEELGDHGDLVQLFDGDAAAEKLHDRIDVVVPELGDVVQQL